MERPEPIMDLFGSIEQHFEHSPMKELPELTLWDFIEREADKDYLNHCEAAGAKLEDEYEMEYICNLGDQYQKFYDWMQDNKDLCQRKFIEVRPYHTGDTRISQMLPMTVGYNHRNTNQYDWGVYGDSNEQLKELIGGRDAFAKMKMDYDTAMCRFLVQMPGSIIPWHMDTMQGWRETVPHINPHLVSSSEYAEMVKEGLGEEDARERSTTDIGKIARRIIAITDWHWGHFIEQKSTFTTKWKSGDVWDSAPSVWHLTGNAGIKLRMSMTVTGVMTE